jgi:hypothetical protein
MSPRSAPSPTASPRSAQSARQAQRPARGCSTPCSTLDASARCRRARRGGRRGGHAFCAGMDLDELLAGATRKPTRSRGAGGVQAARWCRHPTIAMVQGDAFAGSCEPRPLRPAPGGGRGALRHAAGASVSSCRFPRAEARRDRGSAATSEILLTGRPIDAFRAREMGSSIGWCRGSAGVSTLDIARHRRQRAASLRGLKASILGPRPSARRSRRPRRTRARRPRSADAAEGIRAVLESAVRNSGVSEVTTTPAAAAAAAELCGSAGRPGRGGDGRPRGMGRAIALRLAGRR